MLDEGEIVRGRAMPTVLIVEDEIQVLMLAESILKREGYDTLTAATVAEAQAIINSDKKLDLVVADITLNNHPEGGITVGQLVKQYHDGVPVLYASGRELTDGMKEMFARTALPRTWTH
jgi:DNA-binding NtrC family response regulator